MTRSTGPKDPFFDAVTLFQAGKLDKADRKCRQVVTANPAHVDAMHLRAMIAMRRNEVTKAIDIMERALAIKPQDTALLINLGNMLMADGRSAKALARFLDAIEIAPHQEQARSGAGAILIEQGRFRAAEPHFRAVLAKSPRNVEALLGLARSLDEQARAGEAADVARKAIAIAPQNPMAEASLAGALKQLHDFDGAIDALRRAMDLSGRAPTHWLELVANLASFGRIAEADSECRALIATYPNFAPAHVRLATLVRKSSPEEIAGLERVLSRPDLPVRERIQVEFALGAALEGNGAYSEAFSRYDEGNRRARETITYSKAKMASGFAEIRSALSAQTLAAHEGEGHPDPTPIFVVGMPRSGTTLVEQILSSHPEVVGANELEAIPRLFSDFVRSSGVPSAREAFSSATSERLRQYGEAYLKELRSFSSDARFIIDKLPGNFAFLGFIALILPEAKIVHCRRDPLDTCVSIYKTRFVRGSVDYGYDLGELGHYYRLYREHMRFWDEVLPKKPIDIVYEELVADTRTQSERLLNALGLDWSESCERFYETRRTVLTASLTQVRRPIYTTSIGRAARFGAAFDPLRHALAGEDEAPDSTGTG